MNRALFLTFAAMALMKTASAGIVCGDNITISFSSGDSEFTSLDAATAPYTFYISDTELSYAEYTALDASCKPTVATSSSLQFSFNLGDCTPIMEVNSTHIGYNHSIWHEPMGNETSVPVIARYEIDEAQFTCLFERFMDNETISSPITPNIVHTTHAVDDVAGDFTFSIMLTQENYTNAAASTVNVDDWIYVKVSLDQQNDANVSIEFEDCTAHSEANGGLEYDFVENGCAKSTSWDPTNSTLIEMSGTGQEAHVKVKSFIWNNGATTQNIYITCSINACRDDCTALTSSCATNTMARRRRRRRSTENKASFNLMAGPLAVMA